MTKSTTYEEKQSEHADFISEIMSQKVQLNQQHQPCPQNIQKISFQPDKRH